MAHPVCAQGGTRTRTPFRGPVSETGASTNSATWAGIARNPKIFWTLMAAIAMSEPLQAGTSDFLHRSGVCTRTPMREPPGQGSVSGISTIRIQLSAYPVRLQAAPMQPLHLWSAQHTRHPPGKVLASSARPRPTLIVSRFQVIEYTAVSLDGSREINS